MDTRITPLGTLIDQINTIRDKKRQLSDKISELDAEYKEIEEQIKQRLEVEGMDKATGKKATVSLSKVVVANITDFEELCKYVKRTGHFHLFQRRISDPAFRELAARKPVPGLTAFTKINLNLRSIKGE